MKTFIVIGAALLAAAGSTTSNSAAAASGSYGERVEWSGPAPAWNAEDPADSLYRVAREALNDGDYRRAQRLFGELHDRYPRSVYAGDALYWQAWSMYKYAQERGTVTRDVLESAVALLDRQASDYEDSRTLRDARALRARLRSDQARLGDAGAGRDITTQAEQLGESRGCPSDDDDMRVIALQGLMQMDADAALPILKQVLARRDACTEQLRKTAVFVLSQKRGDEATEMLLDVARRDPSSEVRGDAIQWLGQSRSPLAIPVLDSVIRTSRDNELRGRAIFALSQQNDARALQTLRQVAEDESMPTDLRGQAIHWLGQSRELRDDSGYLRELFAKTRNDELKGQILFAMSQSRDPQAAKWLMDIVFDRNQPTETRKTALHWASQQRGLEVASLVRLYDEMRGQQEMQQQILFSLSQRREDAATDKLMDVARRDPDSELRKNAVFWLSQKAKSDPRVQKFLLDLINR